MWLEETKLLVFCHFEESNKCLRGKMSVRIIINVDSLEKVFSGEIRSVKQGFRHGKTDFDVLLTVHFSIILTINQLNAQNLLL